MNTFSLKTITLLFCMVMLGNVLAQVRIYQPRKFYDAKMELKDGIMHGVGQLGAWKGEQQSMNDYMGVVGKNSPCLFMVYAGVKRDTMPHPEHIREAIDTLNSIEQRYENVKVIPQLGLYIVDFVNALEDNSSYNMVGIDTLISTMNESQRPWYVRIGYEFNGGWNGYKPDAYKKAYTLITERFREKATVPVANVWCYHPTNNKYMDYYPGNSIVDWWAIDLFEAKFFKSSNTLNFIHDADEHGKPVMIGEATPMDKNLDDGREDWDAWFEPYFQLLADNPGIKANTYINWDWTITRWAGWGETRIETSDTISALWAEELSNPIFRHGPYESGWFGSSTEISYQVMPKSGLKPKTIIRLPLSNKSGTLPSYIMNGRSSNDSKRAMILLLEKTR